MVTKNRTKNTAVLKLLDPSPQFVSLRLSGSQQGRGGVGDGVKEDAGLGPVSVSSLPFSVSPSDKVDGGADGSEACWAAGVPLSPVPICTEETRRLEYGGRRR